MSHYPSLPLVSLSPPPLSLSLSLSVNYWYGSKGVQCSNTCDLEETGAEAELRHPHINPLSPELNPICYLLALLGAHHFLRVSRIRVKLLTLR